MRDRWGEMDTEVEARVLRIRMRQAARHPMRIKRARYALALLVSIYVAWMIGYVAPSPPDIRTPTTISLPSYRIPEATEAQLVMDADLLANMARGEDPNAIDAVTWVALNRAGCEFLEDSKYDCDRPILEVVTEGRAFGTMKNGRFIPSWTRDWNDPEVEGRVYVILYGLMPDPTGGSTHFHRIGTWTPTWAPPAREWQRFGSHAFYREARAGADPFYASLGSRQ
jgi:hypothetical protein